MAVNPIPPPNPSSSSFSSAAIPIPAPFYPNASNIPSTTPPSTTPPSPPPSRALASSAAGGAPSYELLLSENRRLLAVNEVARVKDELVEAREGTERLREEKDRVERELLTVKVSLWRNEETGLREERRPP